MYFQKKSKVAVLLAVLLFSIAGLLAAAKVEGGITGAATIQPAELAPTGTTSVTNCIPLTIAGETYRLINNITNASTCLSILADNIVIECDRFEVRYASAADGSAINNTGGYDNIVVKNCLIEEATGRVETSAIIFRGSINSTIENNKIVTKGTKAHGIVLEGSINTTVVRNNITAGTTAIDTWFSVGILLNGTNPATNSLINNNISTRGRYGVEHLGERINSLIYNNSFGQINWTKTNLTTGVNLSVNVNIHLADNVTGFANLPSTTTSDQAFNLNASARIELRRLTYLKTPGLFKDGIRCDNSTTSGFRCSIISYNVSLGILDANVSSFSNYSTSFVNVKPLITQLILNTTDIARNDTNVNLTAYANTSDNDSDTVKVIYNWLRNGTSIAVLNMPFEGVNGTAFNNSYDYSGFANNGNETNGVRWNATAGYDGRGAYMFDGTNDFVFLGNQSSLKSACTDGCTMSAWIRLRGPTPVGVNTRGILSRRESVDVTRQFFLFQIAPPAPDSQTLTFIIYHNGSSNSLTCVANSPNQAISNDTWTHVAARYNFSHTAVFINGTQVGVSACSFATINISTWIGGGANIRIGATTNNGAVFNGTLDDVMIWNRSLSKEQIWALSQNQTNLIVAQETVRGENWTVHATANDGYEDASPNISNNVTILDLTPPAVNITQPSNSSNFSYRLVDFNATVLDTDSSVDRVIFVFNNRTSPFNVTATNFSGTWSASQINTSRFAEGLQGVAVSANDSFNNINYTQYINFTVDRTPPNVTRNFVNNPVNDSNFSIRSSNQTFNTSIFDTFTGVNRVYFWFDNGTSQDFNVTAVNQSGEWIVSYNVSALAEGRQGVRIIANDTVNNINDSFVINFTVDFTTPNVTRNFLNNPVNDSNFSIRSSRQIFNASIFDVLTQVDRVYFWFDNGTGQDFNVTAANQSGNWIVSYNVSDLAEGRQGLRIIANDTVSNINDSAVINFTVDFTTPNLTLNFLNNDVNGSNYSFSAAATNKTFNASVFDNLTEVSNVYFWFDNGTSADVNVSGINLSGAWYVSYNLSLLVEGRQGVRVVANDTVGNRNHTAMINFTLDFTTPNVTLNFLNNDVNGSNYSFSAAATNKTFNASVFDSLTEVSNVYFWFDNGTGQDFNVTTTNQSGEWVVSYNLSALTEQKQGFRVRANDTVGNVNNTAFNFTLDFSSPNVSKVTENGNPDNASNFSIRTNNQTFNFTIFDSLTSVQSVYFWFDNGTGQDFNVTAVNQSGEWIVSYNVSALGEGRQGIRVRANDTVGNINNTALNFTVDFTAPSVNITSPADGATISGTQSFNARVDDNLTAVSTVIFQFMNNTPFNRTASNSSGTWSVSVDTTTISEITLTVTVLANDTVGNINNTQALSFTVNNVAVGGGAREEAVSESTPTTTPSTRAEAAPAPSDARAAPSETASASEVSRAFQSGEASASIGSTGGRTITPYASEKDYKITITNNLNEKLVLSGALKTKEKEIKLEFEENAKKRLQEELLLEGEIDEAALEEELKKLKLLETIEILQAHKKLSHFFPGFLVGKAVAPSLIPSKERINGNLLVDVLINAGELENIVVNPGETLEKEVKIRRGLSLGQKGAPKIIFSSAGEQVLIKDIEDHEELVTGTAVDVDQKTKKLDYYMIFAPRPSGGKETFTVEMNINAIKTKINSQLPLKIQLPFFFGTDSENIYNELLGPYTVNMEKGALIAAQYNTDLPSEYEVITKIFNKEGVVIAENKFEVK